jgi:putative hydrolase of the HAD superfamily
MTISFVIFDMDDVLYDFDREARRDALERLTGRPRSLFEPAIWGSGWEARAEAGDPATAEGYLAGFSQGLGHPISEADWARIRKSVMRPRPSVLALANAVSEQADTALLTNNGMLLGKVLGHCAPEMIDIFGEQVHVSAEFGARKPDPAVYLRLCDRYGHDPAATLMVDDLPENIEGAKAAGLKGHLYQTPEGLRAALRGFGFDV